MGRVVLVNRFFHPDHSATSQMASDLAFHLAARGWGVTAITSRLQYEGAERIEAAEFTRGVRIVRVWTSRFGRHNLIGRSLDYATFYLTAFFAVLRHARRDDAVIAMTDPPLLSVVVALATMLRRARLVNWVQDLFPEVAVALGMRVPAVASVARDWSLRRARPNVVISARMAARVPNATVQENWAPESLAPVDRSENRMRVEWNLGDRFVVGYSGNLGRGHDATTIAQAIDLLRGPTEGRIHFLFTGSGAQMLKVESAARSNATFLPYQPLDRLSDSLSASDAHLVSLNPALEGLLLPSKFYGVLAVARPVIFVGDPDGEISRIIREHACGVAVPSGDGPALAATILRLADDRELSSEMGRRGRALYESRYAARHAFRKWEQILGDS